MSREMALSSNLICESLRLRPIAGKDPEIDMVEVLFTKRAAFSVPQSAPTDRSVDGYVIPAGVGPLLFRSAQALTHLTDERHR